MGAASRTSPARPRVSRGTLTREDILRTAVELIESDPQQPITMERVANALGTRPMSLYTHVRNRDDLMQGAFELSFRSWTFAPRATATGRADWETDLRNWCRSLREHARRYSPLITEWSRDRRFQPALLEKIAVLARILRHAGLGGRQLAEALRWIPPTVLGTIVLERSRPDDLQSVDDEAAAIFASLQSLSASARSELRSVLPYFAEGSLTELFEYSLDRLIEGVRCQVDHCRRDELGGKR